MFNFKRVRLIYSCLAAVLGSRHDFIYNSLVAKLAKLLPYRPSGVILSVL
jgi:hypothetical protein